jgi:hypothetical protein
VIVAQNKMDEIKKTLAILKARWPEVTFIIGVNVLLQFANKLLSIVKIKPSFLAWITLGSFLVFITITILITGFQRTAYLEGPRRQSPVILLRTGIHFFWRMIGLYLIYIPVLAILVWLTFLTIKQFVSLETSFWETAKVSPVIYQLCFIIPGLILIKPLLFIFPLIIVLDCRISKSFKMLKYCKLAKAKELVILYLVASALALILMFSPPVQSATKISQHFLIIIRFVVQNFISLMIAVMAVRFVASQNLLYDNGPRPLNSQNLLKTPI